MLGELFDKYGSDKQRLMGYGPIYDGLVLGREITRVLEIGVKAGASLRAWREAFPGALVYGMDIAALPVIADEGVYLMQVDSLDPKAVPILLPFDLIVDDGNHAGWAQLETMKNYLPLTRPDGIYVIEDVETDESAANLMSVAHTLGYDEFLVRSTPAPNIYDNRMVIIPGRER